MPPEATPGFVDDLLSLSTSGRRTAFLQHAGLLNPEGLERLLEVADRLLGRDPGEARRLAELCMDLAQHADAPAAVPHANYILAGAHNLNGEFEKDLRLTKAAHDGYVALGMNLEALRTNVGKMGTLLYLGRYQDALDAGQVVLDALNGSGELAVKPTLWELTAGCGDVDPHNIPCMYERSSKTSDEMVFTHHACGSIALKTAVSLLTALVQQNRGVCLEYMGRYDETLDAYAFAEEGYRTLDMTDRLGEILDNRAAILSFLGRGTEALAAHQEAAAVFEEAGLTFSWTKALTNACETHLRLGNYTRSLATFEQSRRLLDTLDALADKHLLLRHMADAYLQLNLYPEALAAYQEADGMLRSAGMAHERAQTLWGMGATLVALSESEEAERVLDEAVSLFHEADNAPLLSGVILEQASLRVFSGDQETAKELARRALDLVSGNEWPVQQVYARLRLADLLLPDSEKAEPHLLEARRLAEDLALPQLRYRLNERLGRLRRLQGRDEEAEVLLEAAVGEIERLRGTVAQDAIRASFSRDKTAAYEDLLRLHLARDGEENARRAFAVAERAKSRALVDLLGGITQAKPRTSADPELEARLRDLRADLNATYNRLLGAPGDDEDRVSSADLQARAVELEREISRLSLRAAASGAATDVFVDPTPYDSIQNLLSQDAALLAYHVVGDEILAFVNVGGRIRVARSLSTADEVRHLLQKLAVQWDRFSVGGDFAGRHAALLERSARQVLAALYAELVELLETLLEEAGRASGEADSARRLVVVPHGPLHQVPFHALFDGERYLIERFEVSYAPSATVYALCQERTPHDSDGAVVFGVDDPLIPAATAEARAVAQRLPEAEVCTGEEATIAALRSAASGCGVLHLASHGMFRADNPMFSALKLHDGWLMAADVMDLDLDGALARMGHSQL